MDAMVEKIHRERLLSLLTRPAEWDDPRYLHWDRLKHRKPPADLSYEEWWFVIKSDRQRARRVTPFADSDGQRFTYTLPDQVLEQLHWIDSQAHGRLEGQVPLPGSHQRDRYIIRSLMEEAITSSQLEGAATTRKVALNMLRSGRKPRNRDEHMIRNNWYAMQAISASANEPLTEERVLALHARLTENTLDNPQAAGRLQRPGEERVHVYDHVSHEVLHTPPPANQLPRRLRRLVRFANGEFDGGRFIHPVLKAITLHFMCAFDHPFEDGNGRTARALFYWCMLHQGYWLFEFISISRLLRRAPAQYGRAFLYTETDDNDLTYFFVQQLEVIRKAISDLYLWLDRKADELAEVQRVIHGAEGLNHRQKALLVHAMKHPHQVYTIQSHQKSHGVAYATARADLFQLADEGWLNRTRRKRPIEFVPTQKLSAAGRMT